MLSAAFWNPSYLYITYYWEPVTNTSMFHTIYGDTFTGI